MEFKDTAAFKALEKILPDLPHKSLVNDICKMAFLEGLQEGIKRAISETVK